MKSTKITDAEDGRGVSPVIGVILMVAITVILAAVIAAFVLDIGPGDADPQASVEITGEDTSSVTIELQSTDGNADGVAIVGEDVDGNDLDDGEVYDVLTTSGEAITIEDDSGEDRLHGDYEVRVFSGEPDDVENVSGGEDDDIADSVDAQTIIEEFTLAEDD